MFSIQRIRDNWQREAAAIDQIVLQINDATAAQPIRNDGWTTHDVLGHLANVARGFMARLQPGAPPMPDAPFDVDAFNEQQRQKGRQKSWPEVQAYWQRTRDEVAGFLQASDDAIGEQPVQFPARPEIKTADVLLRALIAHTRLHREELERSVSEVQA